MNYTEKKLPVLKIAKTNPAPYTVQEKLEFLKGECQHCPNTQKDDAKVSTKMKTTKKSVTKKATKKGRPTKYPEMECALTLWIQKQQDADIHIDINQVIDKALSINAKFQDGDKSAVKRWVKSFLKRKKIELETTSTSEETKETPKRRRDKNEENVKGVLQRRKSLKKTPLEDLMKNLTL